MTYRMHALTSPLLAALLLAAVPAGAQAPGTLFAEGQAAMRRKDYATACPKFEELTRVQPGAIGHHLTLGQCYEAAGRLANAWRAYATARSLAAKAGRGDQEKSARIRIEVIEHRLSRIIVVMPDAVRGAPGLVLEYDGAPLEASLWAQPFPAERGRHVVAVTAPGKQRWEKVVEVSADGTVVPVEVPLLVDGRSPGPAAPPPPPPAGPPPGPGPAVRPPPAAPPAAPVAVAVVPAPAPQGPQPPFWNGLRTSGAIIGGVGIAGVAVGAVFGGLAISKKAQSNDTGHCGPPTGNNCDAAGVELRNDGLTFAKVSTALFIPGLVLAAGGVTLFALGSVRAKETRVGVGPGSISVSGTW